MAPWTDRVRVLLPVRMGGLDSPISLSSQPLIPARAPTGQTLLEVGGKRVPEGKPESSDSGTQQVGRKLHVGSEKHPELSCANAPGGKAPH